MWGQLQPPRKVAAQMPRSLSHVPIPAPVDPGKVFAQIHPSQQRDRAGVRQFPVQQRGQPVSAGQAIEKLVGRYVLLHGSEQIPLRKLLLGALPENLLLLMLDAAQAVFIKRERVSAPEQRPPPR